MTVIPLESLPLGFRFRPTDEELISHYLKRKITGEIRSEREVIPEIDVCKCEPWDLPDKALIRSDDPEWFFFAPKDRKYPNGSRSNRATEKGYWKATGKDRVIRSKGPARQAATVGMKKTLVFHKGRAPRGERTHWIMHEYRTTEAEYDSSEQGGYVLYKLFRKADERAPGQADQPEPTNVDEVDRSGFSPAPSRSSPGEAQQDGDTSDEYTAPVDNKSFLPEDHVTLPDSIAGQKVGIQRWLRDGTDCKPFKQNEGNFNVASGQPQNMQSMVPAPFSLLDQISNPQYIKNEHSSGSANQGGRSDNDNVQPDEVNHLINSFFADCAVMYSPGESTRQDTDAAVSDYVESANQGVVIQDEATWPDMINLDELLMEVPSFDIEDFMIGSNENAGTDQDIYSIGSGSDSLQDLINSPDELITQRNHLMPSSDASGLVDTGITIRPRQPNSLIAHNIAQGRPQFVNQQNTNLISSFNHMNYMPANNDSIGDTGITVRPIRDGNYYRQSVPESGLPNHGTARRRVCLQTRLDFGTSSCSPKGLVKPDETELDEQVDENSGNFNTEFADDSSDASSVDNSGVLSATSVNDDCDAPKVIDRARVNKSMRGPKETKSVQSKSVTKRATGLWFVISAILVLFIGMLSVSYSIVKA